MATGIDFSNPPSVTQGSMNELGDEKHSNSASRLGDNGSQGTPNTTVTGNYSRTAAAVIAVAGIVLALFAVLCLSGIFPVALCGGVIGAAVTLGVGLLATALGVITHRSAPSSNKLPKPSNTSGSDDGAAAASSSSTGGVAAIRDDGTAASNSSTGDAAAIRNDDVKGSVDDVADDVKASVDDVADDVKARRHSRSDGNRSSTTKRGRKRKKAPGAVHISADHIPTDTSAGTGISRFIADAEIT